MYSDSLLRRVTFLQPAHRLFLGGRVMTRIFLLLSLNPISPIRYILSSGSEDCLSKLSSVPALDGRISVIFSVFIKIFPVPE